MTAGLRATSAGVPSAMTLPKSRTVIRSQTSITSFTLCSTRSTEWSARATPRMRSAMALTSPGFMPAVGSSSSMTRGAEASARAISTRRCSP